MSVSFIMMGEDDDEQLRFGRATSRPLWLIEKTTGSVIVVDRRWWSDRSVCVWVYVSRFCVQRLAWPERLWKWEKDKKEREKEGERGESQDDKNSNCVIFKMKNNAKVGLTGKKSRATEEKNNLNHVRKFAAMRNKEKDEERRKSGLNRVMCANVENAWAGVCGDDKKKKDFFVCLVHLSDSSSSCSSTWVCVCVGTMCSQDQTSSSTKRITKRG